MRPLQAGIFAFLLICGVCTAVDLMSHGWAAPDKAEQEVAIFETEQAEPLTAVERASKVLGLLKHADGSEIDEAVLQQTLDDFALLKQLPAKASEEAKAANFVRQLQIFLYQNSKQVALARAEASYNAESTWTKEVTAK